MLQLYRKQIKTIYAADRVMQSRVRIKVDIYNLIITLKISNTAKKVKSLITVYMPRLNHKLVYTNKPYLTCNNHTTTNSFNGSISRSTRLSRHQISQKYTSPTVYTFIITMRLLSSYQFPPVGSGGQFSPSV